MAFKGTKKRSAKELTLAVESGGGQLNACTSEDLTVYEGNGEAELMPVLIEILADMVWNSTFPQNEIEMERDVIGEEIVMIRENPSDHIGDLLARATWPAHPLGQSISGSLESIEKIDRSALKSFAKLHHFRSDIVIATAGPMGIGEVLAALVPHLPKKFHGAPARLSYQHNGTAPGQLIDTRATDQLQLALSWLCPGRHAEERHALRLLSLILGESSSSRLFTELREERGLCYQISSEAATFEETGALQIISGLDPDSRDEALETILQETNDLATKGPRAGELDRAKRLAIAQSKLAFESTAAHAAWAGEGLLYFNRIPAPSEAREKILRVSDEEVQLLAEKIFSESPATAEIRAEK